MLIVIVFHLRRIKTITHFSILNSDVIFEDITNDFESFVNDLCTVETDEFIDDLPTRSEIADNLF